MRITSIDVRDPEAHPHYRQGSDWRERSRAYNEWLRDRAKSTRVYVWPDGENIIDNLMNRRLRPYNVYRKEVIPSVLEKLGLPVDTKVNWSQTAGCSCGCSPGFIIKTGPKGVSVHVHVTE